MDTIQTQLGARALLDFFLAAAVKKLNWSCIHLDNPARFMPSHYYVAEFKATLADQEITFMVKLGEEFKFGLLRYAVPGAYPSLSASFQDFEGKPIIINLDKALLFEERIIVRQLLELVESNNGKEEEQRHDSGPVRRQSKNSKSSN